MIFFDINKFFYYICAKIKILSAMNKRKEILQSPDYNSARLQIQISEIAKEFMESQNITKTELADYLGCSDNTIKQILSGDFNGTMDELYNLMASLGKITIIIFADASNEFDNYL